MSQIQWCQKRSICTEGKSPWKHSLLLMHYHSTTRDWHTKLNIVGGNAWFLILSYLLIVNRDGQSPSQMHGTLGGPPYMNYQKNARRAWSVAAELREVAKDDTNVQKLECLALRFVNAVGNTRGRIKLNDFTRWSSLPFNGCLHHSLKLTLVTFKIFEYDSKCCWDPWQCCRFIP